jgi:hypothetical protein
MRKTFHLLRCIPKPLRIFFDLLLAAVLFFAWFVARGGPRFGEVARFRQAEKANLVGPSEILDKLYVQGDWIPTHYQRLLIGDTGDEILFYTTVNGRGSTDMDGALIRREKTDGILLTPLPGGLDEPVYGSPDPLIIPLFLFVDDPAAVQAKVSLKLLSDVEITYSQVRGKASAGETEGWQREKYFLFHLPIRPESWNDLDGGDIQHAIVRTNQRYSKTRLEIPAVIRLYDEKGRLIEKRDYVIRSRREPED